MRIAYLVADLGIPLSGTKGASVHARSITEAISRLGHEVVCYMASPADGSAGAGSVPVRPVALDSILDDCVQWLGGGGRNSHLRALRRREIAGLCLNDPFRRCVEEDHRQRPFDLILERYSLWSIAGARLARGLSIPFLLEVNAPLPEEARRHRALGLARVARAIRRQMFREADALIAVSREIAAGAERVGADRRRIVVVPNGFDPALFHPAARRASRRNRFVIGFVGSLKPWHGIEVLCRAFAAVARSAPDARLLVVGDGPLRGSIERFAARARLRDRIELPGSVAHAQVPGLLRRLDVAVAPYAESDGFYFSPLKIFEYMASGLPIVASGVGQIGEVLQDGHTGLLVRPGDPIGLAGAIMKLRHDAPLRRALGQNAARAAQHRFRWDDAARKVLEVAERLVAERTVCRAS